MSYYLATLLGIFNENSFLCCVSDTMGNESQLPWLDKISLVAEPPRLSWLASDYDDTPLAPGSFDLVVINGSVPFDQEGAVLREARRLTAEGGSLLCYYQSSVLENAFRQDFPNSQNYTLCESIGIMTALCEEQTPAPASAGWRHNAETFFREADAALMSCDDPERLKSLAKEVGPHLDEAVSRGELDLKIRLIQLREDLLNRMLDQK